MASFDLDSAISKLELSKTLAAKTAPIPTASISKNTTTPNLSNTFQRLVDPNAQSDVLRTPDDTGSKYDVGYINQLDLQDYRANSQSAGARLLEGGARTLGGAVLKLGEGLSLLASGIGVGLADSATGIGNLISDDKHQEKYAGLDEITDNGMNNFLYSLEDDMKKALPIYKNQNFDDKNLLQQMATTAWWADEGADVLGFALSNLIPAGTIGKLGLGAKIAEGLGATIELAEDGAGVAKTTGGFFAKMSNIGDSIGKTGKMGEWANDVLIGKSGLGSPVQFAKNIDQLAQNAYMTTSEAYFMTRDAGTAVTNNYLQEHNAKSLDELNEQQQAELKAKKAEAEQYTFWSNMAALSFASKVESGFINKIFGHASADAVSGLVKDLPDGTIAPIQREGVSKFLNETRIGQTIQNIPKYAATEGLYKANIQNAIQTIATQFGYTGKLDYIGQVLSQAGNNLVSADAYKQMGANLVVGTLMGAVGGAKEINEQNHAVQRAVQNVNSAKENMVNLNNTLYEKNEDGSYKVDSDGKPVYNVQAITDYVSNTQQTQDLADLHDIFKAGGEEHIATILKNEAFTKYAVAHLEAGLGDELTAKVRALAKYSDEDLAKLGFDPIELDNKGEKVSVSTKVQKLLDQSNQIKQDYQRITKTVDSIPENNARINEAAKLLSRVRTLDSITKDLSRDNMDNLSTLTEQNKVVADFNNRAEQLQASKEAFATGLENGNITKEQSQLIQSRLEEQEKQLIEYKKGLSDELNQLGYKTTDENLDASPIKSELQDTPEYESVIKNHRDIEDSKIAKQGQLNTYNRITNFKTGAQSFQQGIIGHKLGELLKNKSEEDLDEVASNELANYKEGDWIRNSKGRVAQLENDEWGNLSVNGKPFNKDFIKNNPDVHKLTEEEATQHLADISHQERINEVENKIQELKDTKASKEGEFLPSNLKIEDTLNEEAKKARVSEQSLNQQLLDIHNALSKVKDNPEETQKLNQALSSLEALLKKSFPEESVPPKSETTEVDLSPKQTRELKQALSTLEDVKSNFEQSKTDVDNQINDLELEHNKLVQNGPVVSEHLNINNPPVIQGESNDEDPKPTIADIQKTAGSHFPNGSLNEKRSQQRFFKYSEEFDSKTMKSHKLRIVTENDSKYGHNGETSIFYEDGPNTNNVKVLVVDSKGNPITEDGDFIHTSLVEIKDEQKNLEDFKWSSGDNMFRGLSTKQLEQQAIEDYRNLIKQAKESKKPVYLQITGKSRGIQIKGEPISAEEAFGKEKEYDLKVVGNPGAKEQFTTVGGKDFRLPQGLVYINYRGVPVTARLRTLTENEQKQVLQKLKDYASKRGSAEGQAIIQQLRSTVFMGERGFDNTNSIFFIKGKDSLSFGDKIISHEDLISGKYDQQLNDFLKGQFHQVDRKTLEENEKFIDISDKQWKSYKDYLLSNREENTPLRFEIVPKSNDIDKPQFKNTYLTFNNPKLESKEVKSQEVSSTTQVKDEIVTSLPYDSLTDLQEKNDRLTSNPTSTRTEETVIKSIVEPAATPETRESVSTGNGNQEGTSTESQVDEAQSRYDGDDLFDLNKAVVKDYTKLNPEGEESWFKSNISTSIPYERVKTLIEGGNYGRFEKAGRVLVSDLGTTGTAFHEGFHVVSQLYFNDKERVQLYDNWRTENPNDKNLEDKQVEEKLAEEFREFMLTDYSSSKNKNLFQRMLDFVKGLIGLGQSDKDKLFQNIGDGKYLDYKDVNSNDSGVLYSVAKAFSPSTEKALFDSMTLALFQTMKDENFTIKDLSRFRSGTLSAEDASRFVDLYNKANQLILGGMEKALKTQSNSEFIEKQVIPYFKSNIKEIVTDHLKYLGLIEQGKSKLKEGENPKSEQKTTLDLEEEKTPELTEDEKSKDTLGIIDSIEFSAKSGMPNIIKLMIMSLPKSGIDVKGKGYLVKNNLGLPTVGDYKRNINILTNELAGLSNLKDQVYKINQLRTRFPEFKRLLEQLGVTPDGKLSPSATQDQYDLQSKFRQQFDKNYYHFYTQLHEGDNNYLIDSNTDRIQNLVKAKWQGDSVANKEATRTENGQYVLNSDYFLKKYSDEQLKGKAKTQSVLSFYKDLGITFTRPDLVDVDLLADKQKALLSKMESDNSISDIFEENAGWINSIISEEVNNSGNYSDNQHINPEGKTVYNVSLNDYISQTINEINHYGLPEHLSWDEESQTGNALVRNSIWKQQIEDGQFPKTIILEGTRINDEGESGQSTRKLSNADVISQQFTAIMNGINPFLRASDKGLEKGISFNKDKQQIQKYVPLEEATTRFSKYLADEMLSSWRLNVEGVGAEFTEYAKSAKDLRVFADVLNDADEKTKNELINKATSKQDAIKLIDSFIQNDSVRKSVQDWLEKNVQDNTKLLEENGLITKVGDRFTLSGIASEISDKIVGEKNSLTASQLHDLVEQFTIHHLTSNIEQTKLLTGDLAFYKDFFKRTSGLVGTKKTAWVGQDVDEWHNTNRPRNYIDRSGDVQIDKESNGKIKSWVFNDVKTKSSYIEDYINSLVKHGFSKDYATQLLKGYENYDEADAQSYMTLPEYREFLSRVGDWTGSHEAIFDKVTNGVKLRKDELDWLFGYGALKPQYFGPQEANELNAPTFYKTSIIPLLPSVVEGTHLEELMYTMHENAAGLAIFQSGSKVANKIGNELYNEEGRIKLANNLVEQNLDYKYMGIQLDVDPTSNEKVVFGTQFRKLVLSELANKDLSIITKKGLSKVSGQKLISTYSDLVNKIVEKETTRLVDKLGLTKVDDNNYRLANPKFLRDLLTDEAFKRNSPDNVILGINQILSDTETKPIDVLISRNKIENILMSIVDNNVIKQQVFGDARVQAASTGFEPNTATRTLADAKSQTWWSKVETNGNVDNLKFYGHHEDGRTKGMEILLPNYMKEYWGRNVDINKLDSRLLDIVGFRIPTQSLSTTELMTIKGFLPPEAGNIVIVPSEIVAKAGSDFDIDKLNLMFPNYTKDEDGNLRYLEYQGNEDNIDAIHNRVQDIASKIISAPENFHNLITPTNSDIVKSIAKGIQSLKGVQDNPLDNGKGYNITWRKNLDTRQQFLDGKDGIAQVAQHNVHHIISQIAGLQAKNNDIKINLRHNDDDGVIDFSHSKSVDDIGNINRPTIQETISAFLNSFVDAAKDPFLSGMNANTKTIGTWMYLLRAGVPLKQLALFMNQPIISDYLKAQDRNNSQFLRANDRQLFQDQVESKVRDLYGKTRLKLEDTTDFSFYKDALSEKELSKNIKNPDKLANSVQQQILTDYLTYEQQANQLNDLINVTRPDTKGVGATLNSAQESIDKLTELKQNTIFDNESIDRIFDNTFLKGFKNAVEESVKMYQPLFFTENGFAKQQLSKIKNVLKLNKFADREKVLNIAKNDLINYTLHQVQSDGKTIGQISKELFSGPNSLPKQLAKAKNNDVLRDNLLIRELYPIISKSATSNIASPTDLDNIKTFNKRLGTMDSNLVTEAWTELFRTDADLADKLMKFSILQSGLNNSPISFAQYIPNEQYINLTSGLLGKMKDSPSFEDFTDKFYKNNYRNNDLVPKIKLRNSVYAPNGDLLVRQPRASKYGEQVVDRTKYPYIKVWNKLNDSWNLYHNTGKLDYKGFAIFEPTDKLGDGYNLREWGDRSIIASNHIDSEPVIDKTLQPTSSLEDVKESFKDSDNKPIC